MSIGIITSIKSIKEIIWPNFLTYQKYYDLCRSKVTAPKKIGASQHSPMLLVQALGMKEMRSRAYRRSTIGRLPRQARATRCT